MIQKIGKYQVLERIGRGGMGTVFKAHDPVLDRSVATS
jgi:serine/threonine-protein kinase